MKVTSVGVCELPGDALNVPVNISIEEIDGTEAEEYLGMDQPIDINQNYWMLSADNYMPRRSSVCSSQYHYIAETKEELLNIVNLLIVPQYQIAINKLKEIGELYHWDED